MSINTEAVFRIQDASGRGPFKPGFSHLWVEERSDLQNLRPIHEEFRGVRFPTGYHFATACHSLDALQRWFVPAELSRLALLGYGFVEFVPEIVIAKSDLQMIVGSVRPFSRLTQKPITELLRKAAQRLEQAK